MHHQALNTTYDADEEDGGGQNATFTVPDSAKQETPSRKLAPAAPPAASKAATVKPAAGPKTPKQTNTHSYDITPHRLELPPEPLHDPENYDINDLKSDEDTDDDEQPRKEIPQWAEGRLTKDGKLCSCICDS